MQNQMHELAKTLPPPRKQNIACDACRYALLFFDNLSLVAEDAEEHAKSSAINYQVRRRFVPLSQQPITVSP